MGETMKVLKVGRVRVVSAPEGDSVVFGKSRNYAYSGEYLQGAQIAIEIDDTPEPAELTLITLGQTDGDEQSNA